MSQSYYGILRLDLNLYNIFFPQIKVHLQQFTMIEIDLNGFGKINGDEQNPERAIITYMCLVY